MGSTSNLALRWTGPRTTWPLLQFPARSVSIWQLEHAIQISCRYPTWFPVPGNVGPKYVSICPLGAAGAGVHHAGSIASVVPPVLGKRRPLLLPVLDFWGSAVLLEKQIDALPDYGQTFLHVLHFFPFGDVLGQMQFPKWLLKGSQKLLAL